MSRDIIQENNENREKDEKNKLVCEIFFITIPFIIITFMIIFLDITVGVVYELKFKPVILTIFILFLINVMLTLITGSAKRSVIIQSVILWIFLFINILRYVYTVEPFTFADFTYISNITEITGIAKGSLLNTIVFFIPIFFAFGIIMAIYIILINRYNFSFNIEFKKRILFSLIPIAILIILFNPPKYLRNFILENIYYSDDVHINTLNIEYYLEDSMLGGMYRIYLEDRIYEPDNYNKEEVEEMISTDVSNENENTWEEANIIVTFSESFFDVSLLEDDITFDKEVTPNFNSLKDEGIFINMISPTYGGVSSNVEFQFLTGHTLDYFSKSYVPFMSFYKTINSRNKLSLLKELGNNDYYTKVVFGKDYYLSKKVYENLGVDKYEEKDVEEEYKGYYTSDEYLMDETIKAFNEKEPGEKIFYMNCTIQSHQTYELDKYDEYDISIESSTLSDSYNELILSYSQGAYDADVQLGRMYEYIQTLDEPTILIFFGDHLPYLYNTETNDDTLNHLSYFNTGDELLDTYRKYNTQCLILANFDLEGEENWDYMSSDMILTSVVNKMGLELSDYYEWLYSIKDVLPSSNYLVSQDTEGNLYWTSELPENMQNILDERELAQYYIMYDN